MYILGAFAPESDILIKQLREIVGNNVKLTGIELGVNVSSYKVFNGYWFSAPAFPNDEFMKKYTEKYADDTFINFAGMGYTELSLLIDAFENANANDSNIPTADSISEYFISKMFDSVFGVIKVKSNGQIDIPVSIMKAEDGKLVTTRAL